MDQPVMEPATVNSERREQPRRQVIGVRLQSATLNGRIVDLSGGGVGIETPQCVSQGEHHTVVISYGGKTVTADAAVRWISRVGASAVGQAEIPVFRAGLELHRKTRFGR